MKLFVSPHNDDETLFGAFTILREQPVVLIVFDSYVQQKRGLPGWMHQRRNESIAALKILGIPENKILFGCLNDSRDVDVTRLGDLIYAATSNLKLDEIYLPAFEENGHHQHNLVAHVTFPRSIGIVPVKRYLTYTTKGKSVSNNPVSIENPIWIAKKLQALACYTSQMNLDPRMGCWPHFLRSQEEFYA
jgi:LmbE family N-acetylglucosaminyl deacetylase